MTYLQYVNVTVKQDRTPQVPCLTMDSSPFAPMKPSSEGPNPLRPYYKPPSIGSPIESSVNSTANNAPTRPQVQSYGSSARNILSDIDYNEFLGEAGPTTGESIKSVFDQLIWKYTSVFMAQPFEVARTVLQCLDAGHLVVAEELRHKALGKRKANSAAGRSGWSQSVSLGVSASFEENATKPTTASLGIRRRFWRRAFVFHINSPSILRSHTSPKVQAGYPSAVSVGFLSKIFNIAPG